MSGWEKQSLKFCTGKITTEVEGLWSDPDRCLADQGWTPFRRSVPGSVQSQEDEYNYKLYSCTVYSSCALQTGITLTNEEGGRDGSIIWY